MLPVAQATQTSVTRLLRLLSALQYPNAEVRGPTPEVDAGVFSFISASSRYNPKARSYLTTKTHR